MRRRGSPSDSHSVRREAQHPANMQGEVVMTPQWMRQVGLPRHPQWLRMCASATGMSGIRRWRAEYSAHSGRLRRRSGRRRRARRPSECTWRAKRMRQEDERLLEVAAEAETTARSFRDATRRKLHALLGRGRGEFARLMAEDRASSDAPE